MIPKKYLKNQSLGFPVDASQPSREIRPKNRIHEIMEKARPGDRPSRVFDIFMILLVTANIAAVILETVESLYKAYAPYFIAFEGVSIAVFTIEYLLRVWVCTCDKRYAHPFYGRLAYARSPLALIDLLAIAPFYLSGFFLADTRIVRVLRLIRLLRILKVVRYSYALQKIIVIIARKKEELILSIGLIVIALVMVSSLMYFAENGAQPDKFSSIPASMWWGVATMTTVGYGDIYPVTSAGKILAGMVALLGIGLVALPGAIIVAGYFDWRNGKKRILCPHCKKKFGVEQG
ncbi:MAG TPA: ion transporter [Candidatus Nanoarchaeia archaeon]|nr:ion transporter [Candidatus Nanoarchaeia archaeon]